MKLLLLLFIFCIIQSVNMRRLGKKLKQKSKSWMKAKALVPVLTTATNEVITTTAAAAAAATTTMPAMVETPLLVSTLIGTEASSTETTVTATNMAPTATTTETKRKKRKYILELVVVAIKIYIM